MKTPVGDAALERFLRKRIWPPGRGKTVNFAESNVYICPVAMLDQLHHKLGDKKFFALARTDRHVAGREDDAGLNRRRLRQVA